MADSRNILVSFRLRRPRRFAPIGISCGRRLQRTAILSNEKYRGIRITVKKNVLTVQAHNPEQEEAEEEIEVSYDGADLEVGFNVNYLLDALAAIDGQEVELGLTDSNSSCLIRSPGNCHHPLCRHADEALIAMTLAPDASDGFPLLASGGPRIRQPIHSHQRTQCLGQDQLARGHLCARARALVSDAATRASIRRGTDRLMVFGETDAAGSAGDLGRGGLRRGHTRPGCWRARRSLADLAAALPVQIIDPEVHRLIEEGPSRRRRFLDWGVFHVEPSFVGHWQKYHQVLRQRNAALRSGQPAAGGVCLGCGPDAVCDCC